MLQLKQLLFDIGQDQRRLAEHCNVSRAAISEVVNHNRWPKRPTGKQLLRTNIRSFLTKHQVGDVSKHDAFLEMDPQCANTAAPDSTSKPPQDFDHANDHYYNNEDDDMLLRKQTLTPEAKRAFGLTRNPFGNINTIDEMWMSPDIRYVHECMMQTAKNTGFLAVIGESGAGKTTIVEAMEARIEEENLPIMIIKPYVLAAEDTDAKGKTLKSTHIAEAIQREVDPLATQRSSPEARFSQIHLALKDSHKSGYTHCIIIEEAHSLPIPTLKHLKRFLELQVGLTKLLSVILIGQTELMVKLSERTAAVREVVQRCEIVTLHPIPNDKLRDFLQHRLKSVGRNVDDIFDASGIEMITQRLISKDKISQLYPLAVGNFVVAALNIAAKLGVKKVTADIVVEVN